MRSRKSKQVVDVVSWQVNLLLRTIKIFDIGYLTVIYFVFGYATAVLFDKVLGDFDKDDAAKKSTLRLCSELVLHIWLIGVLTYIVRNVVELIPFPLQGVYGYNHFRVRELVVAPMYTLVVVTLQEHLRAKLKFVYDRMF
jgi:hypothetical protein